MEVRINSRTNRGFTLIEVVVLAARRAAQRGAGAESPVATPSSTMMTVFGMKPREYEPLRYSSMRRVSSLRSAVIVPSTASRETDALFNASSSIITISWGAIAPTAHLGLNGAPTFRATSVSSGALRARATSRPTGTPPRGSARTSGCSCEGVAGFSAHCRPASALSANVICLQYSGISGAPWCGRSR